MPYPPTIPPNTRTNLTPQDTSHPNDHNLIANALTDIVNVLGSAPQGSSATVQARIEAIAAAPLSSVVWTAYTPAWYSTGTQPSIGNGTISGRFALVGKIAFVEMAILFGSTTNFGTGSYRFGLPAAAPFAGPIAISPVGSGTYPGGFSGYHAIGNWTGWDASADVGYPGTVDTADGNDRVTLRGSRTNNGLSWVDVIATTSTAPVTWASGDIIGLTVQYRIA